MRQAWYALAAVHNTEKGHTLTSEQKDAERLRLQDMRDGTEDWRRWGPYVSERQWGTVREDYSEGGTAWDYFPHDHARSRAYRWGEDGLAGFCDDRQLLCISLALWNERDPILKERLFGLTNQQGNHGEDVKELAQLLNDGRRSGRQGGGATGDGFCLARLVRPMGDVVGFRA